MKLKEFNGDKRNILDVGRSN